MSDYQVGKHEIDNQNVLGEDSDFVDFDFEMKAVFKRFADDIYENDEAGIREPLANAITAVKKAEQEFNIDNGVIEITIRHHDDGADLILRDNGIGIEEKILYDVLSVIGRTTSREDGNLSGKYGIGFLACYKLVGTREGGFIMHTRSRRTGEAISGVWRPGGFDRDAEEKLRNRFDEDEFGTKFKFPLKKELSISDIKNWVQKHAKWSRVPIVVREFDKNGNEKWNEDYGENTLEGQYTGNSIIVENDYFKAVSNPNSSEKTLLLDSPIERNCGRRTYTNSPWNFDIRIKDENGPVVKGEHKGLIPVSRGEYNDMSEDRRENYVEESKVSDDEVTLPSPIGTRDKLEKNKDFWKYVGKLLREEYIEYASEVFEDVKTAETYFNLSGEKKREVKNIAKKLNFSGHIHNMKAKEKIKDELGVEITDELEIVLEMRNSNFSVLKRDSDVTAGKIRKSRSTKRVGAIEILENTMIGEGNVYMAVQPSKAKCELVWEDDDKNYVVCFDSSDKYELYKEKLGWRLLRNINDYTDELDIDQQTVENIKSKKKSSNNAGKDIPNRVLTLHSSSRRKCEVGEIKLALLARDRGENLGKKISDKVVLFPSNTDKLISEYKNKLSSYNIALANCTVGVAEYLCEHDDVVTIDQFLTKHEREEIKTDKGRMTVKEASESFDKVVFHCVGENDDYYNVFSQEKVMDKMTEEARSILEIEDDEQLVYSPVKNDKLINISAFIKLERQDKNYIIFKGSCKHPFGRNEVNNMSVNDEVRLFADSVLPDDFMNSFALDFVISSSDIDNMKGIRLLKRAYDEGAGSETNAFSYDVLSETKIQTNLGEMSVKEAEEKGTVIYHLLTPRKKKIIVDESIIDEMRNLVIEEGSNYKSDISDIEDEIIYVPIKKGRYKTFAKKLESPKFVGVDRGTTGTCYRVPDFKILYAKARLHRWSDNDDIIDIFKKGTEDSAIKVVNIVSELHDKGVEIEEIDDYPLVEGI